MLHLSFSGGGGRTAGIFMGFAVAAKVSFELMTSCEESVRLWFRRGKAVPRGHCSKESHPSSPTVSHIREALKFLIQFLK